MKTDHKWILLLLAGALSACDSLPSLGDSLGRKDDPGITVASFYPGGADLVFVYASAIKPGPFLLDAEAVPAAFSGSFQATNPRVQLRKTGTSSYSMDLKGFDQVAAEQQRVDWCWAACTQMVLQYERGRMPLGTPSNQQEIAARFTSGADQSAKLGTIIRALSPEAEKELQGSLIHVGGAFPAAGGDRLVTDMARGELPLLGLDVNGVGHVVVVTGVDFSVTPVLEARDLSSPFGQVVEAVLGREPGQLDRLDDYLGDLGSHALTSLRIYDPYPGWGESTLELAKLKKQGAFILTSSLAHDMLLGGAEDGAVSHDGIRGDQDYQLPVQDILDHLPGGGN